MIKRVSALVIVSDKARISAARSCQCFTSVTDFAGTLVPSSGHARTQTAGALFHAPTTGYCGTLSRAVSFDIAHFRLSPGLIVGALDTKLSSRTKLCRF